MENIRSTIRSILATKLSTKVASSYEEAIYKASLSDKKNKITNYKKFALEKCGQLMAATSKEERSDILKDIRSGIVGYDCCVYNEYYTRYVEDLNKTQEKPKAVKGLYKCVRGCGSDEFYVWQQQTRGGDEGMTTFRQCQKCGKRGKE